MHLLGFCGRLSKETFRTHWSKFDLAPTGFGVPKISITTNLTAAACAASSSASMFANGEPFVRRLDARIPDQAHLVPKPNFHFFAEFVKVDLGSVLATELLERFISNPQATELQPFHFHPPADGRRAYAQIAGECGLRVSVTYARAADS